MGKHDPRSRNETISGYILVILGSLFLVAPALYLLGAMGIERPRQPGESPWQGLAILGEALLVALPSGLLAVAAGIVSRRLGANFIAFWVIGCGAAEASLGAATLILLLYLAP